MTDPLVQYLTPLLSATFGKDPAFTMEALLSQKETLNTLNEPNRSQIYFVFTTDEEKNDRILVTAVLEGVPGILDGTTEVLTMLKREVKELGPPPYHSQFHFQTLSVGSVTDSLYRQLSGTFEPILTSKAKEEASGDGKSSVGTLLATMQELLTTLKGQQRFAFADLNIMKMYHPEVINACQTLSEIGADDLADHMSTAKDPSFIADVHRSLKSITKEVQAVCEKQHTISSVREEIMFWDLMEKASTRIEQQLGCREMDVTLRILRRAQRISVFSIEKEVGIATAKQKAREHNQILHDFPIALVYSAQNMDDLKQASYELFNHIKKINKIQYPPHRALTLMDCVMKEFTVQVVSILKTKKLLSMPFEQFDRTATGCQEAFSQLENDYRRFHEEVGALTKKKSEKVHLDHLRAKTRVQALHDFRRHHNALMETLKIVFPPTEASCNAVEDATAAHISFVAIEEQILDTTTEGELRWKQAIEKYDNAIECVESNIVTRLKARLSTATTATEMFRVFSQFSLLFFRPKIKLALQQYQGDLISKVKDDIQLLHDKFTAKYHNSQTAQLTQLRDVPPVSGFILWVRQLERQLNKYLKRIDDVYGKGWERIKFFRKSDGTWSLNDTLAQFMGVELQTIRDKVKTTSKRDNVDDLWGTAFAIAFVELVFNDEKTEWDTMVNECKTIIKQMETKYNIFSVSKRAVEILEELGVGELHVEESDMRKDCFNFREKMNEAIHKELERWNVEILSSIEHRWEIFVKTVKADTTEEHRREEISIRGSIFKITTHGTYQLQVNFNQEIHQLIKEMRAMKWMGLMNRIKFQVTSASIAAQEYTLPASALTECLLLFYSVQKRIRDDLKCLVAGEQQQVHKQLALGIQLSWESEMEVQKVSTFAKQLHKVVSLYKKSVDDIIQKMEKIEKLLEIIGTCRIAPENFIQNIAQLQKIVDQLVLGSFANVENWVYNLNKRIEAILLARLVVLANSFIEQFAALDPNKPIDIVEKEKANVAQVELHPVVCEVKLAGRVIVLDPSIPYCREKWLYKMHSIISWVCDIPRITTTRYEQGGHRTVNARATYANVFSELKIELQTALFKCIEQQVLATHEFLMQWRRYQALWDMDIELIFQKLGDDMVMWLQLLQEIRNARDIMVSSETEKNFGAIQVKFGTVQQKIATQYDHTCRQFVDRFRSILQKQMTTFYTSVSDERRKLENMDLVNSTDDMFAFLCEVPRYLKLKETWGTTADSCTRGQAMLILHRAKLPNDWLDASMVESEWNMFMQVLQRRLQVLDGKKDFMKELVRNDAEKLEKQISKVATEWDQAKPEGDKVRPSNALKTLGEFDERVKKMNDECKRLSGAQEALGMPIMSNSSINILCEDIDSNRQLWSKLAEGWKAVDELGGKLFMEVQTKKLGQDLRDLEDTIRNYPGNVRTFAPYEYLLNAVRANIKCNAILTDLRGDAIQDRHWTQIQSQVKAIVWRQRDVTVGQLWSADLLKHEKALRGIIRNAQGELAIENYLKSIRRCWEDYALEWANYQQRVYLIKGWDAVFEKLNEHLNALNSMKMSPYFKEFEAQANDWDDKLNKLKTLFEIWVEVQRRWVYLEGIFTGSQDIKHQLPNESAKFEHINKDFLPIMSKAYKEGSVLKVFGIEKIRTTLEKIHRELATVQKALGEYLENQRASFPRFYFVGDEDLLEIIGNAKNPPEIVKHFKKMFCGISAMQMEGPKAEGAYNVQAMLSAEGEAVPFATVVTTGKVRINDWLKEIEAQMAMTLQLRVNEAVTAAKEPGVMTDAQKLSGWIAVYPNQVVCLAVQILWTAQMVSAFAANGLSTEATTCETFLKNLSGLIASTSPSPIQRSKYEHLITIMVYQRDVTRRLDEWKIQSAKDYSWLSCMRFDMATAAKDSAVNVHMADALFGYSFEYLGIGDRLVQTPLTDKCYLTLTQALHSRLGGSPFGPAGTGKTETVKALGNQLGRFVLVFNCDENFDFKAMGRIFVGLCQVGAWGCFDEFNRLEERILSAVSQQIQFIQEGLRNKNAEVELVGRRAKLHPNVGVFITMNPGYAGRSNLPDNLKQLFRSVAMVAPDRENIAEVMLFAQGFKTSEKIAKKIVPLFKLCKDQLSPQQHYDFGLRALKSVLTSSGQLKRSVAQKHTTPLSDEEEMRLLLQSVSDTMQPKLVMEDLGLFQSLLQDVFPNMQIPQNDQAALIKHIHAVCNERFLVPSENFLTKILQVHQIQGINHGLMLVGPSGSGKTAAWTTLMRALARLEDVDCHAYVLDPKAISKNELYGTLDSTTRDWQDGVFTQTLRRVIDNVKGDDQTKKRHWIIFDGDVDPEWVENMNSLLDDNRLLTLPNGERLALPSNVRIVFEVQDLKYATLATVSRCGMVWFSSDIISLSNVLHHIEHKLRAKPLTAAQETVFSVAERGSMLQKPVEATIEQEAALHVQCTVADILHPYLEKDGFMEKATQKAMQSIAAHSIMEWNVLQSLTATMAVLNRTIRQIIDLPQMPDRDTLDKYITRKLLLAVVWGMSGSSPVLRRVDFAKEISSLTTIEVPSMSAGQSLLDFDVDLSGTWVLWKNRVPQVEIAPQKIGANDIVIQTVDTVRHEDVISSWLFSQHPVLLCGPPGSGKTMTLTAVLRYNQEYDAVFLNFSSATQPEMIMKVFEQYCTYKQTVSGTILTPISGKILVVFCDEINLPAMDKYGTQRIISFMRQLTERRGFYRTKDYQWISLDRIQFVGACNPPTDPGRVPLTHRYLRWAPLMFVDFPSHDSLIQIYHTFCRSLLKNTPSLRQYSENLTNMMVTYYEKNQQKFTAEVQRHYVYSPRELSRWTRAVYEGIISLDEISQQQMNADSLVRLAAHEGLRLFQDRLVEEDEQRWSDATMDEVVHSTFPRISPMALERPIVFSTLLTRAYTSVTREELRKYAQGKLRTFSDEEMDVQMVLFDSALEHLVRIDRILRQPLGHMLLVGVSGAGKTVLSKFVAWLNHLSVFQIKAHRGYKLEDFEDDLRQLLRRAGCKGEKICFIFDESNIMDSGFLEYMNALLASGDVPGLFEGDERVALMNQIKEGINSQSQGRELVDVKDEADLYKWFVTQISHNLHVVFTMNPQSPDFYNRTATSPALFNRCTIDWFGEWSPNALRQVALEYTKALDLVDPNVPALRSQEGAQGAVVSSIVKFHHTMYGINAKMRRHGAGRGTFITPRHFLDFVMHFLKLFQEKREDLQEQQRHLSGGLQKLRGTEKVVEDTQHSLEAKERVLAEKQKKGQEMLQQIVDETQKATKGGEDATRLEAILSAKKIEIAERITHAETSLSGAVPALDEAKLALETIRADHLREIRAYATPPPMVKKVLESVLTLMGEKNAKDWDTIKAYTRKDDFISSVKVFKPESIAEETKERVKKNYLNDEHFTYANAMKASQCAGPLQKWVNAQVRYADILITIAPLRKEIEDLQAKATAAEQELNKAQEDKAFYENRVVTLKEEYSRVIQEANTIKSDVAAINAKCDRAKLLVQSLMAERNRWEAQASTFKVEMSTIVGDCMVCAGCMAYIGYFDEFVRHEKVLPRWMDHLDEHSIQFKRDISVVEFLSSPDQRLKWTANKLPSDDLCVENAVLLSRFQRYPLVIDPSGIAVEFLMNEFKSKNMNKTSFLDVGFMKILEMALRFGTPLLVQDVENIDPILNPILNKEVRKTGGRTLIRLGDQDVDLSPAFSLFMTTRDSSFQFSPDLCGRVTFVNFTVTPGSLQSQCLNKVLMSERPDVEERRSGILKLQGEYRMRLRVLEQDLLRAISQAEGNILENQALIHTLENLKKQAKEVQTSMDQSESSIKEISVTSAQYTPIAVACSKVFFTLRQLTDINLLYQYSLNFFFGIVTDSLPPQGEGKPELRIKWILRNVFHLTYERVSRAMIQQDKLAFAMRLAQIRTDIDFDITKIALEEWDLLLKSESIAAGQKDYHPKYLTPAQRNLLEAVVANPRFGADLKQSLQSDAKSWNSLVAETDVLKTIPDFGSSKVPHHLKSFRTSIVVKVLRPDALPTACEAFIKTVFDTDLQSFPRALPFLSVLENSLQVIQTREADPYSPVLLCSTVGYDASFKVEDLARSLEIPLSCIAMGSAEGYDEADKAITGGTRTGTWILLKNVHLAPQYLQGLEKRLHSLQLERKNNERFRLFMTSEIHPKLPSNLLVRSVKLVFEPPPGIRSSLMQSFGKKDAAKPSGAVEKCRVGFLVAWLHAVVLERRRYLPLGWSKAYEFSESDYHRAMDMVSSWIDWVAQGRANVPSTQLPWKAIRHLLSQTIYGGRIDNTFDQMLLDTFINYLFCEQSFSGGFRLAHVTAASNSLVCDELSFASLQTFVKDLPDAETPEWLGLPFESQRMVATQHGTRSLLTLLQIQNLFDSSNWDDDDDKKGGSSGSPEWARKLSHVGKFEKIITPINKQVLETSVTSTQDTRDPIVQALRREVKSALKLTEIVRRDIRDVVEICNGTLKPTNHHRTVMDFFGKEAIPTHWKFYASPPSMALTAWIQDFANRLRRLEDFASQSPSQYRSYEIHLGCLFYPEAFITASRQSVARELKYPLEQLEVGIEISTASRPTPGDISFNVVGLCVEAASFEAGVFKLVTNQMRSTLPPCRIVWRKRAQGVGSTTVTAAEPKNGTTFFPLYLNGTRSDVLCMSSFPVDPSTPQHLWYQSGVCLVAWSEAL